MLYVLLAASHILAPEILDHEMTPQEKKLTGVSRLSDKEKAALQRWIDANYEKRDEIVANKEIAKKHPTISENLQSGHYLRLSDNTLWQVRPQDVPVVQGWITPAEVVVSQSGDRQYPTKLTNSVTGSSVFAKKASSVPAQQIQKTSTQTK